MRPGVAASAAPSAEEIDVFAMPVEEIQARLDAKPSSLGSVSLGRPNGGALFGAVRMPEGPQWELLDARHAWGTQETVDYLAKAIRFAERDAAEGDRLIIGQLSDSDGGRLWPHASHQSGRDVDLGYYYLPGTRGGWYQRAGKFNLDRKRTWRLIHALIVHSDVEHVFISRSVQKLLKAYALKLGNDRKWLDSIFDYRSVHPAPLIRDAMGHTTHMHVRFFSPRAQHLGRHAHHILVRKARSGGRVLQPRDIPLPPRRLPPTSSGLAASR